MKRISTLALLAAFTWTGVAHAQTPADIRNGRVAPTHHEINMHDQHEMMHEKGGEMHKGKKHHSSHHHHKSSSEHHDAMKEKHEDKAPAAGKHHRKWKEHKEGEEKKEGEKH